MKNLILAIGLVILGAMPAFAEGPTDLTAKWICTTNASSSDVASDKAADDQMAKTAGAAADSFAFAAKNCRDCTKITCEVSDDK